MIAKPPHDRKLGLNGVALTKQRNNRNDAKALTAVRDEIEKVIIDSEYLEGAPFSWVTIAVRYGLKNDDKPSYQSVNKKYGDLPLSIEVDTHRLIDASLEELKLIFKGAVLKALIHAGKKFERSTGPLELVLESLPESAS
ncbi:immunity protein 39 [Vibrio vulnificus]|uniref:Imm39 family immunity protein n=1 Tax=Vibrio vulnificus TaxID=672 RepID=UPI001302CD4F|nr:Imm39 family immunity protein [Vibrio vulnificus]EHZ2845481.1 immunity protein 39 [Vibrio vulnificus]EID4418135.1 immunity protein 39 [Vibrio vulnificus]EKO5173770.1 immunity protein 39 [Vibrio vulnificus]EKO5194255.1 immunity protein 39 [Vibrio vulnificus]ELK2036132.1 immunity protein 39 [Vibrio vulnificus]